MKLTKDIINIDTVAFLEKEEVRKFVGKNFDKFKIKWLKGVKTKNGKGPPQGFRWNTMAFLSIFTWLSYRKMWIMYAVFLSCMSLATIFESYAVYKWNYKFSSTTYLGPLIVMGCLSTNLYFLHVANFFERNKDLPSDQLEAKIEKEGGASVGYAIAGTIFAIFAIMAAAVFGTIIWPTSS